MKPERFSLVHDCDIDGCSVLAPKPYVRVGRNGTWSAANCAVVDTGSPLTLISMGLAIEELNFSRDLIVSGTQVPVSGLKGNEFPAYLATLDLRVVRTPTSPAIIELRNVVVAVCEWPDEDPEARTDVLLGQHDFLERIWLRQRNFAPFRDYSLSTPD